MRSPGIIRRGWVFFTLTLALLMSGCASSASPCIAGPGSESIKNFCVVTPDVLWRGASPDEEGAAWLVNHGIHTIVNLELLHDDLHTFSQASIQNTPKYTVGYFRIHDWEPFALFPSIEDDNVAHFLAIVSQQPKPIYIHCRSEQNRTGLMVAAYRVIVEGENTENAIAEMARYQGLWFEIDAKYIRGLTRTTRRDPPQSCAVDTET